MPWCCSCHVRAARLARPLLSGRTGDAGTESTGLRALTRSSRQPSRTRTSSGTSPARESYRCASAPDFEPDSLAHGWARSTPPGTVARARRITAPAARGARRPLRRPGAPPGRGPQGRRQPHEGLLADVAPLQQRCNEHRRRPQDEHAGRELPNHRGESGQPEPGDRDDPRGPRQAASRCHPPRHSGQAPFGAPAVCVIARLTSPPGARATRSARRAASAAPRWRRTTGRSRR